MSRVTTKHEQETVYGASNSAATFDLEWPCKVKVTHSVFEALYLEKGA